MRLQLNIGQRLAFGFSLMVLFVIVTAGIGLLYTAQVEDTVAVARDGVNHTRDVAALQIRWLAVVATIDNMLLTRQTGLIDERLNIELDTFNDQLTLLSAQPLGASAAVMDQNAILLVQLQSLGTDLNAVVVEVETAAQEGRWARAQILRHTDLASLQRRFNENLDLLSENIEADVENSVDSADAAKDGIRTFWIVIAGGAVIAGVGGAYRTILSITRPVGSLVQTARAIEGGDLAERADTTAQDEIGHLARAFNSMTAQLQESIGHLEARVQARTRDLYVAAEVSERVATILDPDRLLPQVVELTKDSFDLYHAHVYLYDAERNYLVLAAGAGDAGRIMKDGGHRILASARSLAAQAARESRAVIVEDVRADPNFLPNPLLPDTQSEAALPLMVGDRVIGVLDVQSEQVARFDRDLISVLSTLSGQIAVSLENARLFTEMERTSRQERVLGLITQEMQRATSIDDVLQIATRELGKALRVSETAIELHLPDDGQQDVDPWE